MSWALVVENPITLVMVGMVNLVPCGGVSHNIFQNIGAHLLFLYHTVGSRRLAKQEPGLEVQAPVHQNNLEISHLKSGFLVESPSLFDKHLELKKPYLIWVEPSRTAFRRVDQAEKAGDTKKHRHDTFL